MKKRLSLGMIAIILTTAFLLLSTTSVFAGANDTAAGASITNMATLTFNGGTILESDPDGNTDIGAGQGVNTTFVVDRKVRPYVEVVAAYAPAGLTGQNVYAGGSGYYISFNVMNDGNNDEIFDIALSGTSTVSDVSFTDPATTSLYIDSTPGANESFDPLIDTDLSTIGYNTPTMIPGAIYTIHVVVDQVAAAVADATEDYDLIVTSTVTESAGPDDPATVENVYMDSSGTVAGDTGIDSSPVNPDGQHSARGRFIFRTVVLSMQKTETVIYDPYGLNFHLPGVYVQYNVVISNTTGTNPSPAYLNKLDDTITGGYTFTNLVDPSDGSLDATNAFNINILGSGRTTGTVLNLTRSTGNDGAEENGGDISFFFDNTSMTTAGNTGTEILPAQDGYASGELRNGESIKIKYNVQIDNDPIP